MKALIFNSAVIQVEVSAFEVAEPLFWVDCPDNCVPGWTYINNILAPPIIPQPSIPEIIAEFNRGIQGWIDSIAAQKQYESALHCATYVTSTNNEWSAQAQTFIAWRDSVWEYCYTELPKFEDGERPLISVDEFLTELPVISWPNQ